MFGLDSMHVYLTLIFTFSNFVRIVYVDCHHFRSSCTPLRARGTAKHSVSLYIRIIRQRKNVSGKRTPKGKMKEMENRTALKLCDDFVVIFCSRKEKRIETKKNGKKTSEIIPLRLAIFRLFCFSFRSVFGAAIRC